LLENLIPDSPASFADRRLRLDGYPSLRPMGVFSGDALRRMRSSYSPRNFTARDQWNDGTRLAPGNRNAAC